MRIDSEVEYYHWSIGNVALLGYQAVEVRKRKEFKKDFRKALTRDMEV